jgi:catechol 2,3-dioxygenase-like lactoylglutathione lyase family enzyme
MHYANHTGFNLCNSRYPWPLLTLSNDIGQCHICGLAPRYDLLVLYGWQEERTGSKTMLGIRHIALSVRDLERSIDFYTQVLGMSIEWRPDPTNAYLTSGSDNLALHENCSLAESSPANGPGLDHFGFAVPNPEEVDLWAKRLEAAGIALAQRPKTHRDGARSLYLRDPDGILIQILYHPPISS